MQINFAHFNFLHLLGQIWSQKLNFNDNSTMINQLDKGVSDNKNAPVRSHR